MEDVVMVIPVRVLAMVIVQVVVMVMAGVRVRRAALALGEPACRCTLVGCFMSYNVPPLPCPLFSLALLLVIQPPPQPLSPGTLSHSLRLAAPSPMPAQVGHSSIATYTGQLESPSSEQALLWR